MLERFYKLYGECFDDHNNVKNCGRNKCIELITLANEIEPNVKHGDDKNGFMEIKSIITLYDKLILSNPK